MWKWIRNIVGTAFAILGLADVPDQWRWWRDVVVSSMSEPLGSLLTGNIGRWLLVIAGLLLILWANNVFGRLYSVWHTSRGKEPGPLDADRRRIALDSIDSLAEAEFAKLDEEERAELQRLAIAGKLRQSTALASIERKTAFAQHTFAGHFELNERFRPWLDRRFQHSDAEPIKVENGFMSLREVAHRLFESPHLYVTANIIKTSADREDLGNDSILDHLACKVVKAAMKDGVPVFGKELPWRDFRKLDTTGCLEFDVQGNTIKCLHGPKFTEVQLRSEDLIKIEGAIKGGY